MTGSWVTGQNPHQCDLPFGNYGFPAGGLGSVWRCGECNRLWRIEAPVLRRVWNPAPWWIRMRYMGRK